MAVTKKSVATNVKAAAADTLATPVKTEAVDTVKKEEPAKKEAPKKETAKKEPVKKETVKKAPAKKAAAKKTPAKKAELKSNVHVQCGGNSYTEEDLVKIAKDVWKYDLKQKVSDLTSIELYVKLEDKVVYYVMNKDFTGKFAI